MTGNFRMNETPVGLRYLTSSVIRLNKLRERCYPLPPPVDCGILMYVEYVCMGELLPSREVILLTFHSFLYTYAPYIFIFYLQVFIAGYIVKRIKNCSFFFFLFFRHTDRCNQQNCY